MAFDAPVDGVAEDEGYDCPEDKQCSSGKRESLGALRAEMLEHAYHEDVHQIQGVRKGGKLRADRVCGFHYLALRLDEYQLLQEDAEDEREDDFQTLDVGSRQVIYYAACHVPA